MTTINVTTECIDAGIPGCPRSCPVSKAIGSVLNDEHYSSNSIINGHIYNSIDTHYGYQFTFPYNVSNRIKFFDTYRKMTPFSFELDLPESVLLGKLDE